MSVIGDDIDMSGLNLTNLLIDSFLKGANSLVLAKQRPAGPPRTVNACGRETWRDADRFR